jgi:hypothetical protein
MFNKESLQDDIDDCLEESDRLDDVWANLENISDEAAKLANLAEALLSRVKAIKMG